MSGQLVPCPFCQEPIQPLATKCRFCKEMLDEDWRGTGPASTLPIDRGTPPVDDTPAAVSVPSPALAQAAPVAGYATPVGVMALIAAILAFVVPVLGVLWFSPLAIILGIVALKGGARGLSIAVLVIVTVNMIISPTFWLNIGAGSSMPGATGNRIVTYINVFGVLGMVVLLFQGRRARTVAGIAAALLAIGLFTMLSKPWFSKPSTPSAEIAGAGAPIVAAAPPAVERSSPREHLQQPPPSLIQIHECFLYKCEHRPMLLTVPVTLRVSPDSSAAVVATLEAGDSARATLAAEVTHRPAVYEGTASANQPTEQDQLPVAIGERFYVYSSWGEGCYTVWTRGILYGVPSGETYEPGQGSGNGCRFLPPNAALVEEALREEWLRVTSSGGVSGWFRVVGGQFTWQW